MPPLNKFQRNLLEAAVRDARRCAEDGARAALGYLGVAQASPPGFLNEKQQELRKLLKIHGEQLGDSVNPDRTQATDLLTEEIAYEHWHRMLFAKFLEENGLLMYTGHGNTVPVTLEECEELASDEEEPAASGWELAARCAARMLPQIFRTGSPVFRVVFPPEHRQGLEKAIAALTPEIFAAQDASGWIYQDWQTKRKAEFNASGDKIGARELPAVTQLFTDEYLVEFLLDNSLGAWWAARRLSESDLAEAADEEELRHRAGLAGVPLNYLRFVKDWDGPWTPAAGSFDGWPENLADFRLLDPCCGSGHFLTAAFRMLVPMRMERENLSASEAVDAVLKENIHGLELDRRCVEMAAFTLAMAAWTYPGTGGYRPLPELDVACSGVPVNADAGDWAAIAKDDTATRNAIVRLHGQFGEASNLGSLIDPARDLGDSRLFGAGRESVLSVLDRAVTEDRGELKSETAIFAHGAAKAAAVLAGTYHLIATNVPYLAGGKHSKKLKEHCRQYYPEAKADLATVFLERCLKFCTEGGTVSAVTPQNWLSLTSYAKFRIKLLENFSWRLLARLGPGAFEAISGEVMKAILIVISRQLPGDAHPATVTDDPAEHAFRVIDVSGLKGTAEKSKALAGTEIASIGQARQLKNPDARVSAEELSSDKLLGTVADGLVGLQTGDDPRLSMTFWEMSGKDNGIWEFMQGSSVSSDEFTGQSWVVRWEGGSGPLFSAPYSRPAQGLKAVGKEGIALNRMGQIIPFRFSKERFHQNIAVILPKDSALVPAILCYCSSQEYPESIRAIDQKLNVTNSTLVKVPFDIERWTEIAKERFPNGLPAPYSDDPTQWIFHGHPCGSVVWDKTAGRIAHGPLRTDGGVLQVAVARLLGYRWPAELDAEMELAREQREWIGRCGDLAKFVAGDGIVTVPAVKGEAAAKDRVLDMLTASYGNGWSNKVMSRLLADSDHAGGDLESWLRDKFFSQHCRLFRNRPFIWQIWDGLRNGFSALVNCHKLDRQLLESLTYTYLGDWIVRQKHALKGGGTGAEGARERLDAAESLQKRLEAIHDGEAPYDIFVRWKPLDRQPIGWNPDINDGVRLNIRPFMMPPDVGRKDAGILRDRPNVSWGKDRGKDSESAPWYRADGGERINGRHLKLAEKEKSRS
ncbi:MAG: SAM-dependent DNA methyltransferase [Deltaproteobacteria bacterium]|jgi:hypothetical protein|nr:SAM-dependent DNA methyltransferase [Deltaproteobacteria bacterium]